MRTNTGFEFKPARADPNVGDAELAGKSAHWRKHTPERPYC
jgi:hypothetical protein